MYIEFKVIGLYTCNVKHKIVAALNFWRFGLAKFCCIFILRFLAFFCSFISSVTYCTQVTIWRSWAPYTSTGLYRLTGCCRCWRQVLGVSHRRLFYCPILSTDPAATNLWFDPVRVAPYCTCCACMCSHENALLMQCMKIKYFKLFFTKNNAPWCCQYSAAGSNPHCDWQVIVLSRACGLWVMQSL